MESDRLDPRVGTDRTFHNYETIFKKYQEKLLEALTEKEHLDLRLNHDNFVFYALPAFPLMP